MAIAAATKPIAILRIMMLTPFVLSTPSLSESNPAVPIELRCAALLPGVPASLSHQGAGGALGSPPCGRDECSEAVTARRFNRSFFEPCVGYVTVAGE